MKLLLSAILISCFVLVSFAQGTTEELQELTAKITEQPDNIGWYNKRAEAYIAAGESDKAIADYNKVIELYKANPAGKEAELVAVAYYRIAVQAWKNGKPLDALDFTDEALKLKGKEKAYLLHQARVLASMPARENEAIQKFDNLVVLFDDDDKLLLEYAAFVMPKDQAKGVVLYEKVLRINIMNKYALRALGDFYKTNAPLLSNTELTSTYNDKAIGYYELLYKINPNDAEVKTALTQLYKKQGREANFDKLK